MTAIQEKIWVLQHPENPIWSTMLAAEGTLTRRERTARLGVSYDTYSSWMRERERVPKTPSLKKIISALKKNFGIEIELQAFQNGVSTRDFWAFFTSDSLSLNRVLDDRYYEENENRLSGFRMPRSVAEGVHKAILGKHIFTRVQDGLSVEIAIVVRFLHEVSDNECVIGTEMAVPRSDGSLFVYKGLVSSLAGGEVLYWVFSSIEKQNEDMVFIITDNVRHKADMDRMTGKYLTVREAVPAKPVSFDIQTQHINRDMFTDLNV
jgi:transcriptional regulator with XRE-family HTH domain